MSVVKTRLLRLMGLMVLGGLGAWLVVWQQGKSQRDEQAEAESKRVLTLQDDDADAVTEILLVTPEDSFRIARDRSRGPQAWQILEPVATAADDTTIDGLLRHLLQLERKQLVGKRQSKGGPVIPPEKLDVFGLDPPRYRVALTRQGAGDDAAPSTETLLVGKKNRFDDHLYVKREPSPEVMTVPGALAYQVDKELFNLRERRLAVFEQDAVKRMVVTLGTPGAKAETTRQYSVDRRGEQFYLNADGTDGVLAEQHQITGILSALTGLRATAFVSERASDEEKKAYGFDRPRARLQLTLTLTPASDDSPQAPEPESDKDDALQDGVESESTLTLLLSQVGAADSVKHYGMIDGDGPIVALSDDRAVKKVDVSLDSLRDKKLLHFERDDVASLTLRTTDQVLTFERSRVDDDEENDEDDFVEHTWAMTQPEPATALRSKVVSLLYKLWSLKAEQIVLEQASPEQLAAKGLSEPSLTVQMHGEDGALLGQLAFGSLEGPEQTRTQYATSSAGTRLDLVLRSVVEEISTDPAEYRDSDDDSDSGDDSDDDNDDNDSN